MIDFKKVSMKAGDFVLHELDLHVPEGAYAVLVGATGSGKTSILEMLCGLRPVNSGAIFLAGTDITRLDPAERGIGYVPQDGALFATMTVARQVGLALEIRGMSRQQVRLRVEEQAEKFGITGLLDRRPTGLSGGEVQRVALARALVHAPKVLCLDEPLSALDEASRESLYDVLQGIVEASGATVCHVTHSSSEARRLGTLTLRLDGGRVSSISPNS